MTGRPRGRPRGRRLFGAAGALAMPALVAAAVLAPPTDTVAGNAEPAVRQAVAQGDPDTRDEPADASDPHPPSAEPRDRGGSSGDARDAPRDDGVRTAPSGQRPGTIRLPDGGSATLVREELGRGAVLPIPDSLDEATWWGAGLDAPSGASVFAGHVNWQGQEGPFSELWDTDVGERITVADSNGTKWHYAVSRILTLHKNEVPERAAELFGQSGRHRAVLVTCGGRWEGGDTGYEENRVVIADPT